MKPIRIMLGALGVVLVLVVAACGGATDVPSGAVAVVGGTEITRADVDQWLATTRKGYETSHRDFPKVGTSEYQSLQSQIVAFLVERVEFEQAADDLGVVVTDKEVDKAVDDFLKSRYAGDREKLDKELKDQGFTLEMLRDSLRAGVLSHKIFDAVTKDVKVTYEDAFAYYMQNQSQYGTPESREVRHILIADPVDPGCKPSLPTDPTPKSCPVDFAKSKKEADRIYAELQDGASFAELAKKFSDDPSTQSGDGKAFEIKRGQTVPEFEAAAFSLAAGKISRPVKTQYGYHVIEALGAVKPPTPFDQVKNAVRTSLLQQKRSEVMTKWVEDLHKNYQGKVTYAAGFEPPEIPETPTQTQ